MIDQGGGPFSGMFSYSAVILILESLIPKWNIAYSSLVNRVIKELTGDTHRKVDTVQR